MKNAEAEESCREVNRQSGLTCLLRKGHDGSHCRGGTYWASLDDSVDHPKHYNTGKIEVIDFIEDQKLDFNRGNTVKYICRAPHKGSELEDLKKARWYLDRAIANLEKEKP